MTPKVEIAHDQKLTLGETPHWDHDAKVLYYVDMYESAVLKYDPSTGKLTRVVVDQKNKTVLAAVVPVAGSTDKFVIGYANKIAILTWDGVSTEPTNLEVIIEVEHGTGNRFEEIKADPSGRLWAGTMAEYVPDQPEERKGALYSLNDDGKSLKTHLRNVGISNGMAWSADCKTFYYVESYNWSIDAFDFDIDNGDISNRRVVFDLKENNIAGLPDGMTIDKDDNLWLTVFTSSSVYQVDPETGSLLQKVELPVPGVTSCAWGGPNLDELYVTTTGAFDKEEVPHSGCLFKITGLGTSGLPGLPIKF